jgi:hypothetical protein
MYPQIRKSAISKLPSIAEESESSLPQLQAIRPEAVVTKLSFTHIIELLKCGDLAKRAFYELDCLATDAGFYIVELMFSGGVFLLRDFCPVKTSLGDFLGTVLVCWASN